MKVGLFPGQGIPARAALAALRPESTVVREASEILCYDLRKRVAHVAGSPRSVMPTSLAQPAIFTASVAAWQERSDERLDFLLGHSVGEYAALVAGEAISFKHALCAVAVRGKAMETAARSAHGGMAALVDLSLVEAESIARASGSLIANDNSPTQVVLAGGDEALAEAASLARARGGRAVRLEVTGPFHTAGIASAAPALRAALDHIAIRLPRIPVVSNVSAAPYRAPGEIRKLLVEQLTTRVRFREALENLWQEGVDGFHDFGPGKVVAGLAARTFGAVADAPIAKAG